MVLKITPKQRTKINALVRKTCCNCYKGNCLLLDDLEMFAEPKRRYVAQIAAFAAESEPFWLRNKTYPK